MKIEINREYCIIPFRYDRAQFVSRGIWAEHSPSLDRDALYDFVDMGKQSMRIYGLDFNRCDRFSKFCQKKSVVALDGGDYNPQNETCDALRTKRAKIKTKRFSFSKRSVPLRRFSGHPLFKKKSTRLRRDLSASRLSI